MNSALLLLATLAAQPGEAKPVLPAFAAEAVKPDDKDTPLKRLQKERVRERALALERMRAALDAGRGDANLLDEYVKLHGTVAANLAELVEKPEDKAKCFELRVAALREFEKVVAGLVEGGREPAQRLNLAKAARIDAEIDLLKCKETFALDLPADADGLLKASIADITALATAIEKKETAEKIRAAALRLKATTTKLEGLNLSKEAKAALESKYKADLQTAALALLSAGMNNPEGFKVAEEHLKK